MRSGRPRIVCQVIADQLLKVSVKVELVAQEFAAPTERVIELDGAETTRKFVKEGHKPVVFARHRDDSLVGDILGK